jgi:2,3-bisphosphoglycerate-independent phosphoglycerate mutase
MEKKSVVLLIMDGFGLRKYAKDNAIALAKTPNIDSLWQKYPFTKLQASNGAVGLPKGFIGNSEVGHFHLGAGRLVQQDLEKIDKCIKNKSFFSNKELIKAINHAKKNKSSLHLLGLLSDGGVHSHVDHLFALLKLIKLKKFEGDICIHCMLDGRDVEQKSGSKYLKMLLTEIEKLKINAKISTIMGRYYGMDRDNRWTREKMAYHALVSDHKKKDLFDVLNKSYAKGITDEFVKPVSVNTGMVSNNDSVIFFNFRQDRAREITRAFVDPKFKEFERKKIKNLQFTCFTQYDSKIKASVAFKPEIIKNTLGEILSKNKLKQLRVAETEKFAHVTYFFNGGREKPFSKEKRILVQSPLVKTYDLKPEMSAKEITTKLVPEIGKHDLIVVNLANCDMVGHTGDLQATIKAVETVDKCVGQIMKKVFETGCVGLVTADHGNAEEMSGKHKTTHTLNEVPFLLCSPEFKDKKLKKGSVYNVAPTILKILGVKSTGLSKPLF